MEKPLLRTDLAREASEAEGEALEGLGRRTWQEEGVELCEVTIGSADAAQRLGRDEGRYLTLDVGRVWEEDPARVEQKTRLLARHLRTFLPAGGGDALLVGLGNRHITADAVGPMTMERVLVTRHLVEGGNEVARELALASVATLTPGVLGETGIESADVIRSIVQTLSPSVVIAVDALASSSLMRLATTVQVSDTGLSPGSGVGNRRLPLSRATLGVPVIAIGVPTVVDALTLAYSVLSTLSEGEEELRRFEQRLSSCGLNFFVTPKETDEILKSVSALLAHGINLALHPSLEYEQMLSLVG